MFRIGQATHADQIHIRNLFCEYLTWVNAAFYDYLTRLNATNIPEHSPAFDADAVDAMVAKYIQELHVFLPPDGRLLLAYSDDTLAGCAGLRTLSPSVAELKRMYVRPSYRRRGIGGALIDAVIAESRLMGFHALRLDTARYMTEAQALYRSRGFHERAPYDESDVPKQYHQYKYTVFMELPLDPASAE